MKQTGIYEIRCTVNGKVYIGSSATSIHVRWLNHKKTLRRGMHDNSYLQAAWNRYGEMAFEFSILEQCSPEECIAQEQVWIDEKRAADRSRGFNLRPKAGSNLGFRHTKEAKAKISAFLRGRKLSAEHRAKLSESHSNPSPEYRAKMSEGQRGKVRSLETRANMSRARIGIKYSDETKAKIGAASRLRRHTDETKAKISAVHKGKKKSAETRARMSAAVRKRWNATRKGNGPMFSFMSDSD